MKRDAAEGSQRNPKQETNSPHHCSEIQDPHAKTRERPVGAKGVPKLIACRETGISVLQPW